MTSLPERLSQIKERLAEVRLRTSDWYEGDPIVLTPLDDIPDLVAALEVALGAFKAIDENSCVNRRYSHGKVKDALAKIEKLMCK